MRQIILIIAVLLGLTILFVPGYILWLTWSGNGGSSSAGLLTLNTKDSTRLVEENPVALSSATAQTLFPEGSEARPGRLVWLLHR